MPDAPQLRADFFKAIGHPLRIRILDLLSERDLSVTGLLEQVDVEQPYLSQQLAVLRRAGIVDARREGPNVVYSIAAPKVVELLRLSRQVLLEMASATHDALRTDERG